MDGFESGEVELSDSPVKVTEVGREALIQIVAALVTGATPEELVGYYNDDAYPQEVADMLARPLERDELNAHVDLLLGAVHTATLAEAA